MIKMHNIYPWFSSDLDQLGKSREKMETRLGRVDIIMLFTFFIINK